MDLTVTDEINFNELSKIGNGLLPKLDRLREAEPVAWNDSANGWVVTRHEDVMRGFSGELPLSSDRFSAAIPLDQLADRLPILSSSAPHWIINMDPPRHTRLRKLMTRAFSKKVIEDLRPYVRETIARILDDIEAPCDIEFQSRIARALTGRVILRLFGLPEEVLASFQRWSVAMNSALGSPQPTIEMVDAAEKALQEMTAVLLPEIAARQKHPTEDFLTQLVQASDGSDKLEDGEVMGICYVALIAGHDSTMNSMALGTDLLSKNPDQCDYMLQNPDSIVNSVMELTRLSAMATSQHRVATEDFEWHGKQIRRGDLIFFLIAAANRDPEVFENPLQLDLSRNTEKVATFGPGIHHCIGHLLAKMQMSEFFPALFSRFDVTILDDELHFISALSFRGLEFMEVRLTPKTV